MAIASLKDLYFDELGDLYDAETQMIRHAAPSRRSRTGAGTPRSAEKTLRRVAPASRAPRADLHALGRAAPGQELRRPGRHCSRSRRTSESRSDRRCARCSDYRRRPSGSSTTRWRRTAALAPTRAGSTGSTKRGCCRRRSTKKAASTTGCPKSPKRTSTTTPGSRPICRRSRRSAACATCRWT